MLNEVSICNGRPRKVYQQKPQHKAVLDYLRNNPFITNKIVQELLSVKQTRAYTIIREMVKGGLIVKRGTGKADNDYSLK